MKLSHEHVRHMARLTRLGLSEEEVERCSLQLSNILDNFDILRQVDTSGVSPATHIIPQQGVLRDDVVVDSCSLAEVLSNAPSQEDGCFTVQAILE